MIESRDDNLERELTNEKLSYFKSIVKYIWCDIC